MKVAQIRSDQSLSHVRLFATPWITAHQASLSITNSRSSLRLTSIESLMPSSHLILCRPLLLLPQSLPASESFPMSQFFAWSGQSTGVSALASFLPKKSQGWSPSEWTGWISLQSKGLAWLKFSNNDYLWVNFLWWISLKIFSYRVSFASEIKPIVSILFPSITPMKKEPHFPHSPYQNRLRGREENRTRAVSQELLATTRLKGGYKIQSWLCC